MWFLLANWKAELAKVHEIEELLERAYSLAVPRTQTQTKGDEYKTLAWKIKEASKQANEMVDKLAGELYRSQCKLNSPDE